MLYLEDATYIDWQTLAITRGHLAVEPGPTGSVHTVDAIPAGSETLTCVGLLVTRALVNGHHHIYSTLARGMPPPATPPTTFQEILRIAHSLA